MFKRILLTGAPGKRGVSGGGVSLEVARFLKNKNFRIMVKSEDERVQDFKSQGIEIVEGDFHNLESLEKAMDGIDSALFCYPIAGGLTEAAINFSIAARRSKIKNLVHISQIPAASDSKSEFARMHWLVENMFSWNFPDAINLRAGFYYENLLAFPSQSIRNSGRLILPLGDGEGKAAWVAVKDVALACARLLENPEGFKGETIFLTGPVPYTINEVVDRFSNALDKKVIYEDVEFEGWQNSIKNLMNPVQLQHISVIMTGLKYKMGFGKSTDSFEKITGESGTSIEDFARQNKKSFL